ncbi:uncharacterized protein H6S33_012124 [Morchella sextelata]|uniref:uncharacterized protein n=1 Tax=Morchella sextelata TaxID=1174677 RepID=UPI001D03681A|nr:uncharacterized protein H6S33_012124 [Morchella sextelata]KAH0610597.1 hypothetical protein H6S33_012124 [Morchella sextelata]
MVVTVVAVVVFVVVVVSGSGTPEAGEGRYSTTKRFKKRLTYNALYSSPGWSASPSHFRVFSGLKVPRLSLEGRLRSGSCERLNDSDGSIVNI